MQIKSKMNNYNVEEKYQNMRLDIVLSSLLNISRSQVQTLIKNEYHRYNNPVVLCSRHHKRAAERTCGTGRRDNIHRTGSMAVVQVLLRRKRLDGRLVRRGITGGA